MSISWGWLLALRSHTLGLTISVVGNPVALTDHAVIILGLLVVGKEVHAALLVHHFTLFNLHVVLLKVSACVLNDKGVHHSN
jgi:uncharacterized membrane protein YccF (DUF307 family)